MVGIVQERLESGVQAQIPVPGPLVDSVQDQCVDSDLVGSASYLLHGVGDAKTPNPLTFNASVNCQTAKQDDADVSPWELIGREDVPFESACHERVVGENLVATGVLDRDMGYPDIPVGVLAGLLVQELVERRVSAIESRSVVMRLQDFKDDGKAQSSLSADSLTR